MKLALPLFTALLAVTPARAHFEVTPLPKIVQAGVPLGALASSDPESMKVFKVLVPAGAQRVTVVTSSGRGNVEVFLREGVQPGQNGDGADFESRFPGTVQRVAAPSPAAGAWYVGIQGTYSGVQLLVVTPLDKGALPQPVFSPQPGVYPAPVACQITSRLKGTSVRYTVNGDDPTAASPAATGGVTVNADTDFKARVFPSSGDPGPLAEASYQVRPPNDIIDLDGNSALHHLASAKGGRHLFRITVPAGQRLAIQTEGGKGKSQLSVLQGSIPTVGKPVKGSSTLRHTNRIGIENTAAGEYYIALDATTAYAGRSLLAYVAGNGPDLMPWAAALEPYVTTEEFDASSCEVQEGLIGAGSRRLIRYNTEVRNVGAEDMVMPPPQDNPFFEYHDCHGHWHFKAFASSRLLDMAGNELRVGNKVSFCLLDGLRWRSDAVQEGRYDCENQGIQAGWADVYDSGLPGQWIEIGDLAPGQYQLELTVNPENILTETNYDNNTVTIPVTVADE
jgi:hypothetical protein